MNRLKFVDITAGMGLVSSTYEELYNNHEYDIENRIGTTIKQYETFEQSNIISSNSSLLKLHQFGRKVVKKLPDVALLGCLTFIATELIQRSVSRQANIMPPLIQEIANTTMIELDNKLEMLTTLKWDIDPFFQSEIETMQTQPLEVLDKFVVNEVLSKLDKEYSPLLANLIGDPNKVKAVTKNIKDLVQLFTIILIRSTDKNLQPLWTVRNTNYSSMNYTLVSNTLEKTFETLTENVDLIGEGLEGVVNEWNRGIEELVKFIKSESIRELIYPNATSLKSSLFQTHTLHNNITSSSRSLNLFKLSQSDRERYFGPSNKLDFLTNSHQKKYSSTNRKEEMIHSPPKMDLPSNYSIFLKQLYSGQLFLAQVDQIKSKLNQ